jgi:hypothetical protein
MGDKSTARVAPIVEEVEDIAPKKGHTIEYDDTQLLKMVLFSKGAQGPQA